MAGRVESRQWGVRQVQAMRSLWIKIKHSGTAGDQGQGRAGQANSQSAARDEGAVWWEQRKGGHAVEWGASRAGEGCQCGKSNVGSHLWAYMG